VRQKCLPRLDWSQGIWQEVTNLQQLRKEFVHKGISDRNRFAEASQADMAIDVCRRAIKAIYAHTGKAAAVWVDDDSDPGFDKGPSNSGHGILIAAGADPNHRDTIRAAYVYKDKEHISGCYPAGTDHKPLLDDLVRRMRVPISAVRAYRGNELLQEVNCLCGETDNEHWRLHHLQQVPSRSACFMRLSSSCFSIPVSLPSSEK
jgi:hypothetical protein